MSYFSEDEARNAENEILDMGDEGEDEAGTGEGEDTGLHLKGIRF